MLRRDHGRGTGYGTHAHLVQAVHQHQSSEHRVRQFVGKVRPLGQRLPKLAAQGSQTLGDRVVIAQHSGDQGLVREVEAIHQRVFDVPEFLVDVLGVTDVGAYFPHLVTYHPSCHGKRFLRLGDKPLDLLRNVRGLTLADLPDADQCCGFGGTFSVKNPDVSAAMANDKARHVRETGAEYVVAGDNSCLMNIGGVLSRQNSGVKPIHLVEILAQTEDD